jgi:hypothetical protein
MKKGLLLIILIFSISNLFASSFTDNKINEFVDYLKKGEYDQGIVKLLKNSALEEKVLDVTQTKNNWINQFAQIKSLYGNYLNYEKVKSVKLGKIEKIYYLVYCEVYPIQIVMTEYDNGNKVNIINMEFNDQVLETLDILGTIE